MTKRNFATFIENVFDECVFNNIIHTINIRELYQEYFHKEYSEGELRKVRNLLDEKAEKFLKIGLPRPIYRSITDPNTYITWMHTKYFDYSDVESPSPNFISILNWINECDGNDFLLACSAYFYVIGCNLIFITDQPHDGGIDLIALHSKIPEIPILFFAQAKTGLNHHLSREIFLQELGKVRSLPQKTKYLEYIQSLDRRTNGYSLSYVFLTNQNINDNTYKEASYSEAVLLSKMQIAFVISNELDLEFVKNVGKKIKEARNSTRFEADLTLNIATKFKQAMKEN